MSSQEYINIAEANLLHTYNRFPLVIDHGMGVYLYDCEGKKYLDFAAGIAVNSLGYSDEYYKNALKNQVDAVLHTSNLYYNPSIAKAAEKLLKAAQMDRVFFTNSGTEAIEGALKAAKKYAYTKTGHAGHEIIAMEHSFHGRSIGALSVTGNAHYREAFEPQQKFENPDGTPIVFDHDYLGNHRGTDVIPGPFVSGEAAKEKLY